MKKLISRVCCLCCVVLVLVACLPFSAFAVDPVSAGVMANAFAQAIAAYGASNGVAMTFDVTSTDGIGETVHELWKDFREGTQDADDYATLAAALFPDLYYKASSVVAGAADVYTVGYNISSTYAEEFDNFYNWLLSGPAEMVQVDNQYYQFSSAQIGSSAVPISVLLSSSFSLGDLPLYSVPTSATLTPQRPTYYYNACSVISSSSPVYIFFVQSGTSANVYCASDSSLNGVTIAGSKTRPYDGTTSFVTSISVEFTFSNGYYYASIPDLQMSQTIFNNVNAAPASFSSLVSSSDTITSTSESVGVKAYTNTGFADFPDVTDPNYDATHRAKQIPVSEPWNDTLYGDGTGTLTDVQSEAIADAVGDALVADKSITLAGTDEVTDEPGVDDPPTTDPDDYVVPGLAEIFPFCIPFDIYNFLSALAANPVAPHFTATLDFPEAVGGTQTIDIDFDSPTWNQLAQLLRLLELLAFIIGLALLTRSMFIRG